MMFDIQRERRVNKDAMGYQATMCIYIAGEVKCEVHLSGNFHGRIMMPSPITPSTRNMQRGHHRRRHKQQPQESRKNIPRNTCFTHAPLTVTTPDVIQQDGEGHEAGEPENHGHGFGKQDAVFVGGGREVRGGEDEVEQREQGPDRREDEEVDRVGGPPVGPAGGRCAR